MSYFTPNLFESVLDSKSARKEGVTEAEPTVEEAGGAICSIWREEACQRLCAETYFCHAAVLAVIFSSDQFHE